jgi:hypothetical protein
MAIIGGAACPFDLQVWGLKKGVKEHRPLDA